jgi:TolA-binding protein
MDTLPVIGFIYIPPSITAEKEKANNQIKQISSQLDKKTSTIAELEAERNDLESQITALQNELEGYVGEGGTLKVFDGLMDASKGYIETGDVLATADYLEEIESTIDISQTSAAFQELYAALFAKIGPDVSAHYYAIGYQAYKDELYDEAIKNLLLSVKYDANNRDALFNLANAYKRSEDKENALLTYQKVIELFPGTQSANRSQRYIDELNAQ